MNNWIDRHPFLSFYILAIVTGALAFAVIFAGGPELLAAMEEARQELGLNFFSIFIVAYMVFTMPEPFYALGVVFPAAPSIAAVIIVASRAGKAGIGDLFSRYLPWRGGIPGTEALKTYVALLLGLMALLIVHETFIVVRQGNDLIANVIDVYGLDSLLTFFGLYLLGTTMEMGAFLEELGWRGYGYPVLKKILGSPLKTAIVLGLLWGIWHMPRDLTVLLTGISVFEFLLSQVNFYLMTIGITVMIIFFMNRVGGSIIPAILIHGRRIIFGFRSAFQFCTRQSEARGLLPGPFATPSPSTVTRPGKSLRCLQARSGLMACVSRKSNDQIRERLKTGLLKVISNIIISGEYFRRLVSWLLL